MDTTSAETDVGRGQGSGGAPVASRNLLRRCRDGDDEAWVELVGRYERLVFGVATREGLVVEDAADVTQTVFESLLSALPGLRDDERISAWLYTVARRQSWRVRKRRGREVPSPVTGHGEGHRPAPLGATEPDLSADIVRALWIHDAMQELGEPCRSLLMALYLDPAEPSYAEVALRLGRPLGSIGPTRARCLEHLRALLEREPGADR
jgi:RNA polymerase sigma factor (sigma-70 family)